MKVCRRCVMDETASEIVFDKNGVCNYCREAKEKFKESKKKKNFWLRKTLEIKHSGQGKKHNCIIGISGGIDSTFAALLAVKTYALKPLLVHFDNNWNTQESTKNVRALINSLKLPYQSNRIWWETFCDLQLAFLKAGVPDLEIPTDHAITAYLYKKAIETNIKYIITGNNITTESIVARCWSRGHYDWKYIQSVHKMFGTKPLINYPHRPNLLRTYHEKVKKIEWVSILDYHDYNKSIAEKIVSKEILGWQSYGWKHCESAYTRFIQAYILPTRFGFDKRKAHLSSLIVSGQMDKKEALSILKKWPYPKGIFEEDFKRVLRNFNLTKEGFDRLMNLPKKSYFDYPHFKKSKDTRNGR